MTQSTGQDTTWDGGGFPAGLAGDGASGIIVAIYQASSAAPPASGFFFGA